MAEITTPTREQFSIFLKDQRTIRAFEELFNRVNTEVATIGEDTLSADAKANQAIGTGIDNEIRSKSNEVLLWLTMK
jgi:hypothetical protein